MGFVGEGGGEGEGEGAGAGGLGRGGGEAWVSASDFGFFAWGGKGVVWCGYIIIVVWWLVWTSPPTASRLSHPCDLSRSCIFFIRSDSNCVRVRI